MNWQSLIKDLLAGIVCVSLIVAMTVLSAGGAEIPTAFGDALPYALGGAVGTAMARGS